MSFLELLFWSIIIINYLILIFVVFFERKNTNVVLTWVLVFIFLPYIGFIFYYFFGSGRKMRVFSHKYKLDLIEEKYRHEVTNKLKKDIILDQKEEELLVVSELPGLHALTLDNDVQLFAKSNLAFEEMIKDIENAKETIYIAYYIVKMEDVITKRIVELLIKKAKEGVKIKFIYDRLGWIWNRTKVYNKMKAAGIEVYPYVPSLFKRLTIVNYHYHRKMLIVDGKIAHLGGLNLADEYYGPSKRGPGWRDTNIRITGSAVLALQYRYVADFSFLERQVGKDSLEEELERIKRIIPDQTGEVGIQMVSSGPDDLRPYVKDGYYKMITMARKYLYIQTPYFAPDDSLMEALRVAAANGCDVRIMIPVIPDIEYIHHINQAFAEEAMEYGIKIYSYKGFIHSKTMVVDDIISTVGTANFDIRSFKLDYEVNAFIYDRKFAKEMKNTFLDDVTNAVLLDGNKKKKWSERILESIFRLLAPLV